ncbi:MAG: hypothetical protein JHC33_12950 [Ignisphaera sp.]|nr:hypothetical protein [Ignisphaera sp.]
MNPDFQNYGKSIGPELVHGLKYWEPFHTKQTHLFIAGDTATFYLDENPIACFNSKNRGVAYYINAAAARESGLVRFILRERLGVLLYKVKRKLLIASRAEKEVKIEVPEVEWLNVIGFSVSILPIELVKDVSWKQQALPLRFREIDSTTSNIDVTFTAHLSGTGTSTTIPLNSSVYARSYQVNRPSTFSWENTYYPPMDHTPPPLSPRVSPVLPDGRITVQSLGIARRENTASQLFSEEERRRFNILGSNHNNPSRRL